MQSISELEEEVKSTPRIPLMKLAITKPHSIFSSNPFILNGLEGERRRSGVKTLQPRCDFIKPEAHRMDSSSDEPDDEETTCTSKDEKLNSIDLIKRVATSKNVGNEVEFSEMEGKRGSVGCGEHDKKLADKRLKKARSVQHNLMRALFEIYANQCLVINKPFTSIANK
eukprot:TRINITY_DN4168_c0_g6_i1.p1 TRINITY_DN4168_c0_g6~~TRINITY_DN4168_c0_g6_i1.p1  ORF type:complete len:169 (-),score=41.09 TRINITY_DN4168_c0_g6_i1:216-722(-)